MRFQAAPALGLLLPALVFLPLVALLPGAVHGGGWPLIAAFGMAALQPSFTPALVANAFHGIAITLAIALWSWLLSMAIGLIAAVFLLPLLPPPFGVAVGPPIGCVVCWQSPGRCMSCFGV
ncbi:hypothetical protein AAF134_06035 [Synechococcus lacustris Tous-12m]